MRATLAMGRSNVLNVYYAQLHASDMDYNLCLYIDPLKSQTLLVADSQMPEFVYA